MIEVLPNQHPVNRLVYNCYITDLPRFTYNLPRKHYLLKFFTGIDNQTIFKATKISNNLPSLSRKACIAFFF